MIEKRTKNLLAKAIGAKSILVALAMSAFPNSDISRTIEKYEPTHFAIQTAGRFLQQEKERIESFWKETFTVDPLTYARNNSELTLEGQASWYGPGFHGNLTASGAVYDQDNPNMAAVIYNSTNKQYWPRLKNRWVVVYDKGTGNHITTQLVDNGPLRPGRVMDLSRAGFKRLTGNLEQGLTDVEIYVLPKNYDPSKVTS